MLLPSDVARLILGYLQEEGLFATSQAFIHESPNLKEYAEHSTEDGTIPACVFSIFGKGLTTILNEYVAVKTKESSHQIPTVMTSLWKKLDFTLNQIKALQNSPAISASQRLRARVGLANMARQRALAVSPDSAVVCATVSETISVSSPAQTSHSMLTHSTPVSYSSPHARLTPSTAPYLQSLECSRLLNAPKESPVLSGPASPGRRKWKRSGALSGPGGALRPTTTVSSLPTEEQPERIVDENFPQLVIQNARDKILGDRSLQEKLAENINKILASEPIPQSSKLSANMVEPDPSIDEILGLQGEIHMSDDAIHDILEQTESDPAFQALFDLFEHNKTRFPDGEPADMSSSPEECDLPGPSSVVKPSQSVDSDTTPSDATDSVSMMAKAGQERKTRKSTVIGPSKRSSRIENSSAKLLVVHHSRDQLQGTLPTKRKEKGSLVANSVGVTPMDVDEPPQATVECTTTNASTDSDSLSSSKAEVSSVASEANVSNVSKGGQLCTEQPVPTPTSAVNNNSGPSSTAQHKPSPNTAGITQLSVENTGKDTQQILTHLSTSNATPTTVTSALLPLTTAAPAALSLVSASTATSASPSPSLSFTPITAEQTDTNKAAADSGNIVSLKIIISDNQKEDSATEAALSQAISSISGDQIPTIYLSSPAKSPVAPGTPRGNLDEAAQAVSGLQRSEANLFSGAKAGSLIASPLTGTSQAQQSYIIQLPFDSATTSPASYFLLTEPLNTDSQVRQTKVPAAVSKGQSIAPNQFDVNLQTQGFSTGSALILPSPVKPMVLPLSIMGQNTLGNMQMVPNKLVALPSPAAVQHPETVKPLPTVAVTQSTIAGPEQNYGGKVVQSIAPNPGPSPGHRRILSFDSSGDVSSQTCKITTPSVASTSQSQQSVKDNLQTNYRTKPTILGGNKPKRRIVTVRYSGGTERSMVSLQNQKDAVKKDSCKQDHSIFNKEPCSSTSSTRNADVSKPVESGRSTKSFDRKHDHEMNVNRTNSNESLISRSVSLDSSQKSGSRKEKEPADGPSAKTRESRTERRTSSQESTNVTANKENELKGSKQEQQQQQSSSLVPVSQSPSTAQSKASKPPSMTSSLAKQAAEMLHDIQGLNSTSSPKVGDHTSQKESDCPRTPSQQRKSKDGEGTPRHLIPPNASDVPTCSPASEAGSENSINMAAHTLMILSRAAIARTGTPLKDSLRQEGVGEQSPTTSKNTKKRKQSSPTSAPPAKKESKRTPSKKKDKEKKKLIDGFPHDLDVDKFLSTLHYDE